MRWEELYSKNEIKTNIIFDKDMDTVYELSYFLVDFQAVINNLTEMIYDDINAKKVPMPRIYQCEDKEFDDWCDKVIDTLENAKKTIIG